MKIQVLGTGCPKCKSLAANVEAAARETGIEYEIEKVTDIAEIMRYGVMSTPGVVVDGKLVHSGGVPGPDKVNAWIA